jgi:hypothetical protein
LSIQKGIVINEETDEILVMQERVGPVESNNYVYFSYTLKTLIFGKFQEDWSIKENMSHEQLKEKFKNILKRCLTNILGL